MTELSPTAICTKCPERRPLPTIGGPRSEDRGVPYEDRGLPYSAMQCCDAAGTDAPPCVPPRNLLHHLG